MEPLSGCITYHVITIANGDWGVWPEGADRAESVHGDRQSAIMHAMELSEATNGTVQVHDGGFRGAFWMKDGVVFFHSG